MQKRSDVDEAIILAYKGMSSVYLAKHGWNVFNKLDHFNKGKEMIESAIRKSRIMLNCVIYD